MRARERKVDVSGNLLWGQLGGRHVPSHTHPANRGMNQYEKPNMMAIADEALKQSRLYCVLAVRRQCFQCAPVAVDANRRQAAQQAGTRTVAMKAKVIP